VRTDESNPTIHDQRLAVETHYWPLACHWHFGVRSRDSSLALLDKTVIARNHFSNIAGQRLELENPEPQSF
jgi:hypothetical protein